MSRLINSPGLQITEKDLSLRIDFPVGTQIVVPGFAAQGPTSEPIMVSTISEFETIFGLPTNAAERYFYYSCKEILNSPGVLNAIRLPYGAAGGSDFSKSFSGLFYPAKLSAVPPVYDLEAAQAALASSTLSATNNLQYVLSGGQYTTNIGQSAWVVGAPISKVLNESDFEAISRGDFTWKDPSLTYGSPAYTISNGEGETGAGFFFINDLQSTVNEIGEGYYVGIADNTSTIQSTSPNFDSIKSVQSLNQNADESTKIQSYSLLDPARLDFALSATAQEADTGKDSISENLERVGFADYSTGRYQEHITVGVYKIRRSNADATLLTLASNERYLGSMNANRKVVSPTGGTLENSYIQDVINAKSSTVKLYVNPAIANEFKWTENSIVPIHKILIQEPAKSLFPLGVYTPDARIQDLTKQIGEVPLKLEKALRSVDNPEYITVDVVVDAGLSTIYSNSRYIETTTPGLTSTNGQVNYDDEKSLDFSLSGEEVDAARQDWQTVVNVLTNFTQNTRKDCFAIIDPPRNIFVVGKDTKLLNLPNRSFAVDVYNQLVKCVGPLETSYGALYGNWIKLSDMNSGKRFWAPVSGYVAGIFAKNDALGNQWSAPAGLNRGSFQNALDVAFNPNQKMRDRLYEIGVNPVIYFNGEGYTVFGQKTLQTKPTAFDRINVRRLFLALQRQVSKTVRYFVFEPNTQFTRHRLVATIDPIFSFAKKTQGLYDYLIVCDERNNTPANIDAGELIVDIYLKPVRTAEFILLNFIATRTGQNFQELI
jgi:hypothetical protein